MATLESTMQDSRKLFASDYFSSEKPPRNLSELEKITISVNAGRKITIYFEGDTAHLIFCQYGRNGWDSLDLYRKSDGTFEKPCRGPKKVYDACLILSQNITRYGLDGALAKYRESGICCCCGATLTDPISRQRGIGPECIKRIDAQIIMRRLFGG